MVHELIEPFLLEARTCCLTPEISFGFICFCIDEDYDVLMLVGYTMDNLILETMSPPVEFQGSAAVGVVITDAVVLDCSQNYTAGEFNSFYPPISAVGCSHYGRQLPSTGIFIS